MDPIVVREKLNEMHCELEQIERTMPTDFRQLTNDETLTRSVLWSFCQVTQQCVDVATHIIAASNWDMPRHMRDAFDTLHNKGIISHSTAKAMKGAVTIRNIAIHRYIQLDLQRVHDAGLHGLDDFRAFAAEVLHVIEDQHVDRDGRLE